MDNYIEFKHITKAFSGQVALSDVSFGIKKGEIHALLGENGAGKSTLTNILCGVFPATEGQIQMEGKTCRFSSSLDAIKSGVAKVHQEINLVPELTVMQNIVLGNEPRKGLLVDEKKAYQKAKELLHALKCSFSTDVKVKSLNTGEQQMVQIAKTLLLDTSVLVFDEPTASLSDNEVAILFGIIHDLKERGITIIYISHKLDEIYKICDRATILRDGEYQGTYEISKLPQEMLIQKMVGRDISMFAQRKKPSRADYTIPVLEAKNVAGEGFSDISFTLYKGEILGFFGLVGAKRTESMMSIFGANKMADGEVLHNGKRFKASVPADAIKSGIGLIPEDRKTGGFVKDFSNMDNIALASLKKYRRHGLQNGMMRYRNAVTVGGRVHLTPNDPYFMTRDLSGGNQQKVIVAKWLSTDVDVMIIDEPTKGIDVGSKDTIYEVLEEMVEEGKSIILISSELTEVMGMSDRIITMCDGRITGEFKRADFSEEKIVKNSFGGC